MLCVGQQCRGSCVVCLGGKCCALSKGSSIQHIQRQQILYAVGILCLQQALEHKAGVSGQKFTVGGLAFSVRFHGQRRRSKQSMAATP